MDSASAPILTIEFLCPLLQYILRLVRCELHLYPYPQLSIELTVVTLFGSPEKAAGVADDKGMSLAARAKNIISSCKTNEDDDSCWHSLTTLVPLPSSSSSLSFPPRVAIASALKFYSAVFAYYCQIGNMMCSFKMVILLSPPK